MKATNRQIKKQLRSIWPKLRHFWLVDPEYWIPTVDKLEEILAQTKVDQMQYRKTIADCDDFSLQLHAEIKRLRITKLEYDEIPSEEWYPWAFGEVMGKEFRGMQMPHAVNVCVTRDGVYLIEPRDDRIWKADPDSDNIFFIKM